MNRATTNAPSVKKGTLGKSVKPLLHTQIPRGLLYMVNAKVVVVVADHFPVLSMI
jgi:hypothetical protein